MSIADPIARENAAPRRWLSIVGVGEDGIDGLASAARSLIADAAFVFGGKRHLALVGPLVRGIARPWPTPFERAVDGVGEGKSHAPIMSWRTRHSSGVRERGFTGLRRYGLFNVCHRYQLATVR